jgi:hypothetical protein
MALEAVFRENRPHLALEIDSSWSSEQQLWNQQRRKP